MNLLNKKSQHYDVLGRFRVNTGQGEVEFCRVKFMATKHEDVIPATKVKTGDFEDVTVVLKPTPVKPIVVAKVTEEDKAKLLEAIEESKKQPVEITPIPNEFEVEESTILVLPTGFDIIATNPKGEEITVNSLGLDVFCSENKLDIEMVQAVIEGKQKTHRKWRFIKA